MAAVNKRLAQRAAQPSEEPTAVAPAAPSLPEPALPEGNPLVMSEQAEDELFEGSVEP